MIKKAILTFVILTLLIGITLIPVGANPSKPTVKESTIYGPYTVPYMLGNLYLQEDATYTAKLHIGKLYIYHNLKLTGIIYGPCPPGHDDIAFNFGYRFLPKHNHGIYIQYAIITIRLWIGPEFLEKAGQTEGFVSHLFGQGIDVTIEALGGHPDVP